MTDIMAAIGLVQLKRYPEILNRRKEIIKMYDEGLEDEKVDILKHFSKDYTSSGHLYLVRLIGKNEEDRNNFIKMMAEKGISTNVHYKPLPMFTAYKNLGFNILDFKNAFNMYKNEVTLPLHTLLTNEEVNYVIKTFKECLKRL